MNETPGPLRCAIYTRKSTEEGLEQEFNSLQAQREAGEAFIASQRQAGWSVHPERYDDGGYGGATLERPALERLLAALERGEMDCVVVYKVDRLSRSLLDFAHLMGLFERLGVSFVSVTQQFATTTSLGRLTLNILLSFAQFERELIGERTRDKVSAARRKGKWMGGIPVLGYDVDERGGRLVVNREEAERVRRIFELCAEAGTLAGCVAAVNAHELGTKGWTSRKGRVHESRPFGQAGLARLLGNVLYKGLVSHKATIYPGEQEAIVEAELWDQVNGQLRIGRTTQRTRQGVPLRRRGARSGPTAEGMGRVPRVSRLMALALKLEGLVRQGQSPDYAALARAGHVSRARMSQIVNLTQLAPSIQETLLFLPRTVAGSDRVTEKALRDIAREVDWNRQRKLFDDLMNHNVPTRPA